MRTKTEESQVKFILPQRYKHKTQAGNSERPHGHLSQPHNSNIEICYFSLQESETDTFACGEEEVSDSYTDKPSTNSGKPS